MRFLLDEDVDAQVVSVLVKQGHQTWTVPQASLSAVTDEVVAVYGHQRGAVVVTHDREFSRWRRKRCVGQHLYLRCEEPDAEALLEKHLPDLVPVFERYTDVFAELSPGGLWFAWDWN